MGYEFEPKVIGFLCNWCCYAGADLAGVSRYQYPTNIRIVRVMCSGRVDMAFILRAFSNGMDGVFVGGCWLGECHYITEGNHDAISMVHLCKKLLKEIGMNPGRLRLEWVSASQGIRFAEIMTDFVKKLKEIGPLGISEGIDETQLKLRLEAAKTLVPYIKLLQGGRLKARFNTDQEYEEFFAREEVSKLFTQLIADKLTMTQILLLLQKQPLSAAEISGILGLSQSEVSRHLDSSVSQGFARFDESQQRFVLTVEEDRYPGYVWRSLASYYIDPAKCKACMICLRQCPVGAIAGGKNQIHVIDQQKCIKCGTCFEVCPPRFGAVKRLYGEPVPPPIPEEARIIAREGKER